MNLYLEEFITFTEVSSASKPRKLLTVDIASCHGNYSRI